MKKRSAWEEAPETTGALDSGMPGSANVSNGNLSSSEQSISPGVLPNVAVGRIAAILQSVGPLVDFPTNTSGRLVPARSLVPVSKKEVGREVALAFEENDAAKPIILGIMRDNHNQAAEDSLSSTRQVDVQADEETVILTARKEIVLRCGKSSITLTSAGKVLIRGAYLLSRSSGANRIKGGSVQIN